MNMRHEPPTRPVTSPPDVGHPEPEGTHVLGVSLGLLGIIVLLAVTLLSVAGLMRLFANVQPPAEARYSELYHERRPPSSPSPLDDLPKLRGGLELKQSALRDSWGWVDREMGVAHVPVELAMKWLAAGGRPTFMDQPTSTLETQKDQP